MKSMAASARYKERWVFLGPSSFGRHKARAKIKSNKEAVNPCQLADVLGRASELL